MKDSQNLIKVYTLISARTLLDLYLRTADFVKKFCCPDKSLKLSSETNDTSFESP